MLCKSIVVTLPAAFVIVSWWKRGRVTGSDLSRAAPFFVVGAAIAAADLSFYDVREPLSLGYTAAERLLIAAHALWFYAGKLLWPGWAGSDLSALGDGGRGPGGVGLRRGGGGGGGGAVVSPGRVGRVRWRGCCSSRSRCRRFWGSWNTATCSSRSWPTAPVSGGDGADGGVGGRGGARRGASAGEEVAAVCGGRGGGGAGRPGGADLRHAGIYRDGVTLFTHVVAHNPEARFAHRNLGEALTAEGRWDESAGPPFASPPSRPRTTTATARTWGPRWSCWAGSTRRRNGSAPPCRSIRSRRTLCRTWPRWRSSGSATASARSLSPPRRGQSPQSERPPRHGHRAVLPGKARRGAEGAGCTSWEGPPRR